MGIGTSLAFIAIGSVLAFAVHFNVSGIDIHMIGWILILVGAAMPAITFAHTRPRRRRQVAEIVEDDRRHLTREEERPQQVGRPPRGGRVHDPGVALTGGARAPRRPAVQPGMTVTARRRRHVIRPIGALGAGRENGPATEQVTGPRCVRRGGHSGWTTT